MRFPTASLLAPFLAVLLSLVPQSGGVAGDASQARSQIPVHGVVLGPGGGPLPGARVVLVPLESEAAESRRELNGQAGPAPAASGATGPDGAFHLEAPEAGPWKVVVEAQGLVPSEIRLLLAEETELPAVELQPDAKLEVRVTAGTGSPVPAARVRVAGLDVSRPGLVPSWETWQTPVRIARTDAQGAAVLPRLEGEVLLVQAGTDGQPPVGGREVRTSSVRLRLPAGASRRIRVLDATGAKPLAGVLVQVGEQRWSAGRTAADGLFSVPLSATASSFQRKVLLTAEDGRRLETSIGLPGKSGAEPLPLRLPALGALSGRIVSARDGRPVARALVWSQGTGEVRRVAADGTCRIEAPVDQEVRLAVAARGFLAAEAAMSAGPRRASFTLALEPALSATGTVVDEQGKPVPGVELTAVPRPSAALPPAARRSGGTTRTFATGRFRMSPLAAGVGHELRLAKPGFAPALAQIPPLDPARSAPPLRFVLRRGRIGFGHVIDRTEKPIAGARIVLRQGQPGPDFPRYEAATGPDGRFEVRDLLAGLYELTARGRGYAPFTVPGLRVPPGSGATDLGTVILVAGIAVEGQVVDPQGRPVPEAEVSLTGEEAPTTVLTGADGSFRIEDRRPGETVNLGVHRAGYAPASAGLRIPPGQPVRIVLQPTASVEGSTVGPDGTPVPGALVLILPSNPVHVGGVAGPDRTQQSDENGSFRIEGVTPGSFEIRATAPGRQEARLANLEVRPGQDLQGVEVVLAPGAVIAGRVLSASGEAVSGAEVSLLPEGPGPPLLPGGAALSDEQGRYRLEGVSPGARTVQAGHEEYLPARRRLEVQEGENALDLTLEPGAILSGRVVDPRGAPVAGARVFLRLRPEESPRTLPDAASGPDGSFTLSGLADGAYRLFAEKAGFARSRGGQEVVVAGRSVSGIEVQLTPGGAIVGQLLGLDFTELSQVQVRNGVGQAGQVLPDGSYRIDDVEPGGQRVVASLPGGSKQAEGQVDLEPGAAEARLDLEFGKGLKLTGRVLRGGEPAAGEGVLLSGVEGAGRWGDTDLDGRFHFEGLDAGRYRLQVVSRRGEEQHREEVEIAADRDVLIELGAASISGRVVDEADRSPIANARVVLTAGTENSPFEAEAVTDSRGVFQLRGVAEGSWKVRALLADYAPAEVDVQVAGAPVEGLELALRASEGLTLEVLLPSGRPPGALRAAVLDPGGRVVSSGSYTPGEGGRTRIAGVPPGTWDLLLDADGAALLSIAVTAPGHAGRIVLPQPGGLSLRVPSLHGQAGARVRLNDRNGKPFRTLQGDRFLSELDLRAGSIDFQRLAPGAWTLTVTAGDGRTWTRTAVIRPGSMTQLLVE